MKLDEGDKIVILTEEGEEAVVIKEVYSKNWSFKVRSLEKKDTFYYINKQKIVRKIEP